MRSGSFSVLPRASVVINASASIINLINRSISDRVTRDLHVVSATRQAVNSF